jgi:DNA polymerase (family 10)
MNNREMAEYFKNIADLLEIKGEGIYRVLAYRRAGEALHSLGRDIRDVWKAGQLEEIPGVGKAIAAKIDELLQTGTLAFYEKLAAEVPPSLIEVLKVADVGPKKAALFWKELGIVSVDELEAAAKAGKLRSLRGMGERSETRILESIEIMKGRQTKRVSIGVALPMARSLIAYLKEIPGVKTAEIAGSLRRWRETVGDLDLIVAAEDAVPIMEAFVALPQVNRVRGSGETKASVELREGLGAQLWVHPPARFGTAWQYATGSQAHNVALRELALEHGLSLSEHGFLQQAGGEILCSEEVEVYRTLGLPWIPPEMREDRGELKSAAEGRLPQLVKLEDLVGELHAHTDWSDGSSDLPGMVDAAVQLGFVYLVISDHSQSLGVAGGLSVERLRQQRKLIAEVQEQVGGRIRLLQGAEVEILADGRLDYPDEVLAELDIVTASLHSALRQPGEKITQRLLKAIGNPHVDMIGHPTGRLIGAREPADLDIETILRAAVEHGVILEINAHPDRLDLNDVHARLAVDMGCLVAINSDAHHPDHLAFREYGIGLARRAWVEPESVVNTWPTERLLTWLRSRS